MIATVENVGGNQQTSGTMWPLFSIELFHFIIQDGYIFQIEKAIENTDNFKWNDPKKTGGIWIQGGCKSVIF